MFLSWCSHSILQQCAHVSPRRLLDWELCPQEHFLSLLHYFYFSHLPLIKNYFLVSQTKLPPGFLEQLSDRWLWFQGNRELFWKGISPTQQLSLVSHSKGQPVPLESCQQLFCWIKAPFQAYHSKDSWILFRLWPQLPRIQQHFCLLLGHLWSLRDPT